VDTKILTLMIEKQFGEKFNVFFDWTLFFL
jgi:hypothetical protein